MCRQVVRALSRSRSLNSERLETMSSTVRVALGLGGAALIGATYVAYIRWRAISQARPTPVARSLRQSSAPVTREAPYRSPVTRLFSHLDPSCDHVRHDTCCYHRGRRATPCHQRCIRNFSFPSKHAVLCTTPSGQRKAVCMNSARPTCSSATALASTLVVTRRQRRRWQKQGTPYMAWTTKGTAGAPSSLRCHSCAHRSTATPQLHAIPGAHRSTAMHRKVCRRG